MSTTTGRKVRADAKLERLDAGQQERLRSWLEEQSYGNVVDLVRKEFGLSVGKSAVGLWWRRHVLPERQQDDAESVAELAALPAGDFSAATLQRAWALAFEALARPFPEIDRAAKLIAIVSKLEQHALALKRLALQERKVALREKQAAAQLRTKAGRTTKSGKRREREPARAGGQAERMGSSSEHTPACGHPSLEGIQGAGWSEGAGSERRTANVEHPAAKDGGSGAEVRGVAGADAVARGAAVAVPSVTLGATKGSESSGRPHAGAGEIPPRLPGYSGAGRGGLRRRERRPRITRIPRQNWKPRKTRKNTKRRVMWEAGVLRVQRSVKGLRVNTPRPSATPL